MNILILLLGVLANAGASIMVKVATVPPRGLPSLSNPLSIFSNWPLIIAIGLYGSAFLLYALALTRLPLNVAHPVLTAGSIATVAIASAFLLREPFHISTIIGISFIAVGVIVLTTNIH